VRDTLLDIAETELSNRVMEEVEVAMESHGDWRRALRRREEARC